MPRGEPERPIPDHASRAHCIANGLREALTVLYRVLRMRLKDRGSPYSPERALEIARRIQFHQVTLHQQHTASGLSTLSAEQKELFDALNLSTPIADAV